MSVVDDILTMDSAESRCSINGDTRDIVVPDEYHIFGVESDENVTRIPFICPKIVGDNVDLTGYSIYINYINGAGLGGIYVVDDVVTRGDNITFSWLLSRNVTAKAGTVSYIICAKKSGTDTKVTNEWNTKIATGIVSSGIETYDTVVQQSSDVINKLLKLTQGQSAYDIAIDNGFVGTKAEWLESLKGSEGAPVNWRGAWGENTEYSKLDAVFYDGSSYIFTSDTHVIGSIPGVDEEWGLMTQKGNDGANGVTPHIGDNGNWYIGSTDTGKPARGAKGDPGKNGSDASVTEANITSALGYKPVAPGDIPVVPTADISANTSARHSHTNKDVLDSITAADKTKLNSVENGATKTIVDTAMSDTSTNPVQNKVIKKYIDDHSAGSSSGGSGSSNILTSPVMICKPGEEGNAGIYLSTIDTGEKQAEIKLEDANENSAVAIANLRTPTGANASDYAATKGYVDSKVPTALKNPNALTIKIGSTTVTYDGSTAQTVTIADGSEVSY